MYTVLKFVEKVLSILKRTHNENNFKKKKSEVINKKAAGII